MRDKNGTRRWWLIGWVTNRANNLGVLSKGLTSLSLWYLFQVLSQGSSPLAYLSDHVKKYVACVKDKGKEGCDFILNPPKKSMDESKDTKKSGLHREKILRPFPHYL